MGGEIWVESQVENGSIFHFTTRAATAPGTTIRTPLRGLQLLLVGTHALIVDDNAANRRHLENQLQTWGMETVSVASGPEALTLLETGTRFDVAILDLQMPVMDGLCLARTIRTYEPTAVLPLVMLSSVGQQEVSVDVSMVLWMAKPIKQTNQYQALVRALDREQIQEGEMQAEPLYSQELALRHPLRVLLAEDNLVNRKLIVKILSRLGYRADIAANGKDVLQALQRQPYDVVLMDIHMPEMDGLEAMHHINRTWPEVERPWVIALTAAVLDEDRRRCKEAGMADFINKPVRIEELVTALEQAPRLSSDRSEPGKGEAMIGDGSSRAIEASLVRIPLEETERPSRPEAGNGSMDEVEISANGHASPAPIADQQGAKIPDTDTSSVSKREEVNLIAACEAMAVQFQLVTGEDDIALFYELLDAFLKEAEVLVKQILEAWDRDDRQAVGDAAHALKSSSAVIGASRLSEFCLDLELAGRLDTTNDFQEKVATVEQEYRQVYKVVQFKLDTL